MPYEYKTTRRVEFPDTDMAGIVYFANFFKFMESTEHDFFRSEGLSIHENGAEGMTGWARVHATCDYMRPAHFSDLLEVHLIVRAKTEKTLRYSFDFRVLDDGKVELTIIVETRTHRYAKKRRARPAAQEVATAESTGPPSLLTRQK